MKGFIIYGIIAIMFYILAEIFLHKELYKLNLPKELYLIYEILLLVGSILFPLTIITILVAILVISINDKNVSSHSIYDEYDEDYYE